MLTLLGTPAFWWILTGFLPLPEASEAKDVTVSVRCEHVLNDVCVEFVEEAKTWSGARSSCRNRGGELLEVMSMSESFKVFLRKITGENRTGNLTWWLGRGAEGGPSTGEVDASQRNCSYMTLNPPQLDVPSNCSERRSFICTRSFPSSSKTTKTRASGPSGRSRPRRSIHLMGNYVTNIQKLLEEADAQIAEMEMTSGEPSDDNRDSFIDYLYDGTKRLTSDYAKSNAEVVSQIINCSTAILLLSAKKCDILTNPNPKSLFENVFQIFRKIAELLGTDSNQQFIIRHRTGTIYQNSTSNPRDIGDAVLGSEADGEFAVFPSYQSLPTRVDKLSKVITQLATFTENPHPHDTISGTVSSVLLSDGVADIEMKNLSQKIQIFLPRPGVADIQNSSVTLKRNMYSRTTVNLIDPNMTIIYDLEPSQNVTLKLTLFLDTISSNTSRSTVLTPSGRYRWLITPEMTDQIPGNWTISAEVFNSTLDGDLTLKVNSFMAQCLYWDIDIEEWLREGCQVGMETTPWLVHCLCNHLTLFGSSFFVMPNHVDVSRTAELFATVNENFVVLALLCAFFGLYLVTLLWACYADRRSRSKRKITLLDDNHPGTLYNYLISVQTGHRKNAGTTANVTVKLIGSEGESETQTLTDPDKPVFDRGSVDVFLLSTPFPLGEVGNLWLQHDNSGGRPSWYIHKATVQDLQTRHVYHFFCDCWLSADRGDNMTKKTFNAAKTNEIASFRNIFQTRTSTGFRDEHIWVSIVDPPSRSPFTRAQRVSCCMSLLLCTMAINIAFWNLPVDEASPVIFVLGSLEITWQELMVGIQSGLLMFPINILIITIFRSIRPRVVPKKDNEKRIRPHVVTVPTILKETERAVSLVSKSPRNKISEMAPLESISDVCTAMDRINEFLQLMQGECESDPHWVCCSRFLLACLSHLLMDLEKLDGKCVPHPDQYQMALNTANVLVRKAEMVYSSHSVYCPPPVMMKKTKRKTDGCWLPWWCVFLGWFLLLSLSAVSTYFTLLYGFEYGRDKSIKWVISLALSLFQSIFILQPLKVIGIAVFFALLLKPVSVEETDELEQVLLEQQDRCRHYSNRDLL